MARKRKEFEEGIRLRPSSQALDKDGQLTYDSADDKLKTRQATVTREVTTNDDTQTLENKTIDGTAATGNNTISADSVNITYNNGASGLTATDAQAAIDELKTITDNQNEASEIAYDNSTSGLAATNVQDAIDEVDGNLDTHIAANIAHGTTSAVVGVDDTQTLTNKTIDADNNSISNLRDAELAADADITRTKLAPATADYVVINDGSGELSEEQFLAKTRGGTGADNSSVTFPTTGTIVTEDGTQTITNKTIDADNNTISNLRHGDEVDDPSTDVHGVGVGSDVVGTATTQTLTNKTITDSKIGAGTASATNKLVATEDTRANLDAIAREAGSVYYDNEAQLLVVDDGTQLKTVGTGGGGLDVFYTEDFEVNGASDLRSGNNAAFLGGGSLAGSLTDNTVSPISGDSSPQYTQAAGSLNDYIALPSGAIVLDEKQKGKSVKLIINQSYSGNDDDTQLVIHDSTGATDIARFPVKASSSSSRLEYVVYIPASSNEITVGYQVVVANNGAILIFDDIELTTESQLSASTTISESALYNTEAGLGSTNSKIPYFTTEVENTISETGVIENSSSLGWSFTASQRCSVTLAYTQSAASTSFVGISKNSNQLSTGVQSISQNDRVAMESSPGNPVTTVFTAILEPGDVIRPHIDNATNNSTRCIISFVATVSNNGVITSSEIPVNDFSARLQNNGTASVLSENVSFIQSVNSPSAGRIDVVFNTGLFTVAPSIEATVRLPSFSATDKIVSIFSVTASGFSLVVEDTSSVAFQDTDVDILVSTQGVDYKDLTANLIQTNPKIAYVKNVQASGVDGDTPGGVNSVTTLTLNTVEGDQSFFTLSSNQVTISPGTTILKAKCPAFKTDGHQAFLWDVDNSLVLKQGTSGGSLSTATNQTHSFIEYVLESSTATTIEVRHWINSIAGGAARFGQDTASGTNNPCTNNEYVILELCKIK